jgi:hypothetical protein
LRVTFDTNTLDPVTQPDLAGIRRAQCTTIRRALESKRIEGFFCETLVTVEGGTERLPLRQETVARISRALDLGMRIISAPRIGSVRVDDPKGDLYLADADEAALSMRLGRYESIATAIEARGLGFAKLLVVAELLARRAAFSENWYVSLKRASASSDIKKVARAVAEWADGDSVAAHYAYAIDLFCTEDRAKKAGRQSVMHSAHRAWFRRVYGVKFVDIGELAAAL